MAFRWVAVHSDGYCVHSGKNQYQNIERDTVRSISFFNNDEFIIGIDVKKKFMMRRHTFFKMLSGAIIGAIWSVGWENGWLRKPTVYYISEIDGNVEKHNSWQTKKPIRMDCEK